MTINPTSLNLMPAPLPSPKSGHTEAATGFHDLLSSSLLNVNHQQVQATHLIEENLLGHGVTDVEVMTAMKQADLSMKTAIQVRNKALDAINELKQIQL